MLRGYKLKQTKAAVGSAIATLLYPAPGRLRQGVSVYDFVNHYGARLNSRSQSLAPRNVSGPHTRRQSIDAIVRQRNGFLICLECHDGQNRAEGFFTHYFHSVIDIGEHRWFIK